MRKAFFRFLALNIACVLVLALAGQALAQKTVRVLVVTDRATTRMQPEIFYAFRSAAKKAKTSEPIDFKFTVFNPYFVQKSPKTYVEKAKAEIRENLELVVGVVADLRKRLKPGQSLFAAVNDYAKSHPSSAVADMKKTVDELMEKFGFLVVESTGATVIHPIFYNPRVKDIEVGYATANDVKDTLYGLFFLESALDDGKPVYGTCHGAQLGWLYAGGGLTRLFDYTEEEPSGAYFARRNPYGGKDEVWWMDRMLNSRNPKGKQDYGTMTYPLEEPYAQGRKGLFVNKDFNHTLAMTTPIPKGAKVISYHPLSVNQRDDAKYELTEPMKEYPMVTEASRAKFKSMLKQIIIVDNFQYKTMFGFQFHPQYTYDDMATSAIFEYLSIMADKHSPAATD